MSMNLFQIGLLTIELSFVAGVLLLLFLGRSRFGLLPLAAFIGSNQYFQTILASTHYIEFGESYLISPGSAVLFPAALVAVLLLYHQDGVPKARSLILGILVSNITLTLLSYLTTFQIKAGGVASHLQQSEAMFNVNLRIFLAGTAVLVLDAVAVVVLFEVLSKRFPSLPRVLQFPLGLMIVLAFDAVIFSFLAFGGHPGFSQVISSQLISKPLSGLLYGLILFAFLHRFDPKVRSIGIGVGTGAWAILTYRERIQILEQQKRAQAQAFEKERTKSRQALSVAESRYRTLFETMTDGLLVVNASNDTIVEINKALVELSGYAREELIGKSLAATKLFDTETVEASKPSASNEWDSKLLRRDGRVLDIEVQLIRFASGSQRTLVLMLRDITERQSALRKSEERYHDLFERSSDLIQATRPDGSFLFVNKSWKSILGYSDAEIAELRVLDIVVPAHRQAFSHFIEGLVAGKSGGLIETEFISKGRKIILVEGNVESALDGTHSSVIRGIFRDVTERKAVDRLKDQFVETVSHELRTPLASIFGSLELVASGKIGELPPPITRFIDVALRNSRRLTWLVNEILDFQKIQAGGLTLNITICDLSAVIGQAIEDNEAYADKYGVRLRRSSRFETGKVALDRSWLLQVMTNLLSNAVKHSPEEAEVVISVEAKGEHFRVSVVDIGPGIPEEFHDQVFQPFSQVQVGKKAEEGSSGLGLSIAKMLIDRMGGDLSFESEIGVGTTFSFELPRNLPTRKTDRASSSEESS